MSGRAAVPKEALAAREASRVANTPVRGTPIHRGVRRDESRHCRLRACGTGAAVCFSAAVTTAIGVERARGRCGGRERR
jgi:hypothetical protein